MSFKASMNKMLSKYNILIIEDKKFMTKYAWDFGRKHNFPYSLIKKLCNQHNLESPLEEDWD